MTDPRPGGAARLAAPAALLALVAATAAGAGVPSTALPAAPVHAEAPPAGHTGGFGEADCTACHLEAGPDLPGTGTLVVRGFPERYRPGERYLLEVVLEAEGTERAGFQLAVRGPDGRPAGALHPVDGRVQILTPDSLPASYAAQTAAGSVPADRSGATWTVAWIAPGDGEARLHAAANSADGDESPLGDLVFTTTRSALPGTRNGTASPR